MHPDSDWFWAWMKSWTLKRRDRMQQSEGRNIARIDDYAITVIQSNGAHQWRCFQLTVAQWQQFANELDWAYVQNIAQFQEQLAMALTSPNHTTRLGAQWIIAHNPQWGVQVSNGHLVIAQDVRFVLQHRLAPALREWERLQWSTWNWQQALEAQVSTQQLSRLTDEQLGAWVDWLRLQPNGGVNPVPPVAPAIPTHMSTQKPAQQSPIPVSQQSVDPEPSMAVIPI